MTGSQSTFCGPLGRCGVTRLVENSTGAVTRLDTVVFSSEITSSAETDAIPAVVTFVDEACVLGSIVVGIEWTRK